MRKIIMALAILVSIGLPAAAQFRGPSASGQPATVAQAEAARLGSYVTLTGNITEHLRSDYFTFVDSTGSIRVEIPSPVWQGREVTPETNVQIMGEVDRGLTGRYIYVKSLQILN